MVVTFPFPVSLGLLWLRTSSLAMDFNFFLFLLKSGKCHGVKVLGVELLSVRHLTSLAGL